VYSAVNVRIDGSYIFDVKTPDGILKIFALDYLKHNLMNALMAIMQ
jgi:hypothetical protein